MEETTNFPRILHVFFVHQPYHCFGKCHSHMAPPCLRRVMLSGVACLMVLCSVPHTRDGATRCCAGASVVKRKNHRLNKLMKLTIKHPSNNYIMPYSYILECWVSCKLSNRMRPLIPFRRYQPLELPALPNSIPNS